MGNDVEWGYHANRILVARSKAEIQCIYSGYL